VRAVRGILGLNMCACFSISTSAVKSLTCRGQIVAPEDISMICMISLRTLQISACLHTWRSHAMHVAVRCRLTARRTRSNGPASAVIPIPTNLSHQFLHHLAVQPVFRKLSLLDTEHFAPARSLGPPAPPLPAANHRHGCLPQRSVARLQRQQCLPQYALSTAFSPAIAADLVGCSSFPSIVIRTSF
jgi:hypothetical protein